jgi:hypothetical protein
MSPCTPSNQVIPILSLIVAVLAVFVGPFVTLRIGRKQVELSRRIASKQIVAPMRQAWINSLREKLAELTAGADHCLNSKLGELRDEEQKRLTQLEHEIELSINPTEGDHGQLVEAVRQILIVLKGADDDIPKFNPALEKARMLGQKIFKDEWNRIKDDIEKP